MYRLCKDYGMPGRYSLSRVPPEYTGAKAQLAALGELHVGYSSRSFPTVSGQRCVILGARPFSKARRLLWHGRSLVP